MASWLAEFFAEPIRETNALQRRQIGGEADGGWDARTIWVLALAAVSLTLRAYFFHWRDLLWCVERIAAWWPGIRVILAPEHVEFTRHAYWALGQDLLYVVPAALTIKLVFRESLADYGLKLRGMFKFAGVYLAMFAVMAPLILLLARTDRFQAAYPFYNLAPGEPFWPKFIAWELLYATQFVALEFFFRGFMVHGTKHRFGAYCVLVMMVPYCMIHFTKPLPETLGAIVAGVALGLMSLKTRSIWLGAALHIAVAWSMDAAAVFAEQAGGAGRTLF